MKPEYRLYSAVRLPEDPPAWAEIDLSALCHNYQRICAHLSEHSASTRPIAVVKADAYGHGAPECVKALLRQGCDFFAVASLAEAMAVRVACAEEGRAASVLILGYTNPQHARELAALDLIQALLSADYANALAKEATACGVVIRSHIAVDSGMNRLGFPARDDGEIESTAAEIARLASLPGLSVEGMFSHFAAADAKEPSFGADFTRLQRNRYDTLRRKLEALGVKIPFHHFANSAATLSGDPETLMHGARVGILLYGVDPCGKERELSLRPVMKLKTRIIHIHPLPAGEPLGYGCAYRADTPRVIATLPIGYADGFLRSYGGELVTVRHGDSTLDAPLVGRICMDQCMIDVTGLPVAVGDEVTLFGETHEQLKRLSASANTIDYEVLCLVSARVPRIYTDFEKKEP